MAISRDCGRCKGTGRIRRPYKDMWGGRHEMDECNVCRGNGRNPDYREKRCEYQGWCSTTIVYSAKSSHPPTLCPHHKEVVAREKQEANSKRERDNRERQQRQQNQPRFQDQQRKSGGQYGEKLNWSDTWTLPGSDRSLTDLRRQGAQDVAVRNNPETGGHHVTIIMGGGQERYSYDTDSSGNFIQKRAHFTDKAAKLLGKDTIGPDATNKNRW